MKHKSRVTGVTEEPISPLYKENVAGWSLKGHPSTFCERGKPGIVVTNAVRESERVVLRFMGNPNTLRPALIRRMPKFNLRLAEIKTISDYILSAYQAPGAGLAVLDGHTLGADAASRGKQLFYTRYGCQACHIADYKTDKGYVGPALAGVGNRLAPEWMTEQGVTANVSN